MKIRINRSCQKSDFAALSHLMADFLPSHLWVSKGKPGEFTEPASSDLTYTDTGWHHVAGVREGQINALYVDGVKQSETSVTDFVPSEDFFHIGRQYSNKDYRYFRGLIDDVRVYNQALSAEEIAALVQ